MSATHNLGLVAPVSLAADAFGTDVLEALWAPVETVLLGGRRTEVRASVVGAITADVVNPNPWRWLENFTREHDGSSGLGRRGPYLARDKRTAPAKRGLPCVREMVSILR